MCNYEPSAKIEWKIVPRIFIILEHKYKGTSYRQGEAITLIHDRKISRIMGG